MRKIIAHMRNQEDHKKKKFAFAIAFSVTLVIALLWLATFSAKVDSITNASYDSGPIKMISQNMASVVESVKGVQNVVKNVVK